MLEVYKQALAEDDLINIWCYSCEQWGVDQADLYLDQLNEGINGLAENPKIGMAIDHIRQGYRRYHVQHHMIYYRIRSDRIEIIRVLLESMDTDIHL